MIEDQQQIQKELLELTIKAGRRLMHDFDHLLNELPKSNINKKEYEERAKLWRDIFYADNGPKNYRTELHLIIDRLEIKCSMLEDRLKKYGLNHIDDLPY